jgi:hypothetical protein
MDGTGSRMTIHKPSLPPRERSGPNPVNRGQSAAQLVRDQRLAEVTERLRLASSPGDGAVSRDDIAEEPTCKAFENRVRIAFLATKGATMAHWLVQREALLTDAVLVAKI